MEGATNSGGAMSAMTMMVRSARVTVFFANHNSATRDINCGQRPPTKISMGGPNACVGDVNMDTISSVACRIIRLVETVAVINTI